VQSCDAGVFRLWNPYYDSEIRERADNALGLAEGWGRPPDGLSISLRTELLRLGMIMPHGELAFREDGLTTRAGPPIGFEANILGQETATSRYIGILGMPDDRGAGSGASGSRGAPAAIRGAFEPYSRAIKSAQQNNNFLFDFDLGRICKGSDIALYDFGNVAQSLHGDAQALFWKIDYCVQRIARTGGVPVLLGGDHSLTLSSALATTSPERPISIIHFDAHHDCYMDSFRQRNALTHGNFMAHLLDDDRVTSAVSIGLRTFEARAAPPKHFGTKHRYVSASRFAMTTTDQLLERIPKNGRYYVTIDMDAFCPDHGGDTATPEWGGLDPLRVMHLIYALVSSRQVVGIDIVELQPFKDVGRKSGSLAARLILTVLMALSATSPLNAEL
jgi:agmatinase